MIQQTSLEAYEKIVPTLGKRQREVLFLFYRYKHRDFTNTEAAYRLGLPINCVTPRVLELRRKGLLELSTIRKCSLTKHRAMSWRLTK